MINIDHVVIDHDAISRKLFAALYNHPELSVQFKEIIEQDKFMFEPNFLGFMAAYKFLSGLIPKNMIIYDFGCAYGFQAYYFRDHRLYIGIDSDNCKKLILPNTIYHKETIESHLKNNNLFDGKKFAIVNYVSLNIETLDLIKRRFSNMYIFYP